MSLALTSYAWVIKVGSKLSLSETPLEKWRLFGSGKHLSFVMECSHVQLHSEQATSWPRPYPAAQVLFLLDYLQTGPDQERLMDGIQT